MQILVTGGAGYIGSHTCICLLEQGHDVIVIDNLSNSHQQALSRVEKITGKKLTFYQEDILHQTVLERIFNTHTIDAVIHFAGLKAVGESTQIPLQYYHNNITGSLVLLEVMQQYQVKNLVFSSSATVYGDPKQLPITEDFPTSANNPYGRSKLLIEEVCRDIYHADPLWNIALLRYFNPIGAHHSGQIGEDPQGIPNNLLPYIAQVAVGKRESLSIFGNDYATCDGTGVRDYIHVMDLAEGHSKALDKLQTQPGLVVYNLGTGKGYSVLEVLHAFEQVAKKAIPYHIVARRAGDIAACYADPHLAKKELGWIAKRDLHDMVSDTWHWQIHNPQGYI